jgi:hypothetical protein
MTVQDLNALAFPTLSEAQISQGRRFGCRDGSMALRFVHEYLKTM